MNNIMAIKFDTGRGFYASLRMEGCPQTGNVRLAWGFGDNEADVEVSVYVAERVAIQLQEHCRAYNNHGK